MEPQSYLRFEAGAELIGLFAVYFVIIDGQVWLFLLLILAPDVSMLGYLIDAEVGSITYNTFHIFPLPLLLAAIGSAMAASFMVNIAIVWATHIALDRTVGYGLKYQTGFKPIHLQSHAQAEPCWHS